MKRPSIILAILMAGCAVSAADANKETPPPGTDAAKSLREGTEWTNIWITCADKTDKPHVLLIGDSITQAYHSGVEQRLAGKAYVGRVTTSLCVSDPAFDPMLRSALLHCQFQVIHFNNGLHGVGYTEEQYRAGYEKSLRSIREIRPEAKLIVALSTPLNPKSAKASLNPRIDQRNAFAADLAKHLNAQVNDLHALVKDHPEYYSDPYHFHGNAVALQAAAVATAIGKHLTDFFNRG